jgi:hypothetical protein
MLRVGWLGWMSATRLVGAFGVSTHHVPTLFYLV